MTSNAEGGDTKMVETHVGDTRTSVSEFDGTVYDSDTGLYWLPDEDLDGSEYTIDVEGKYYWKLLFQEKNSAGTTFTYEHKIEEKKVTSKDTFQENIRESASKITNSANISVSADAAFEIVNVSTTATYGFESVVSDMMKDTTQVTTKEGTEVTNTTTQKWEVGPNSELSVYQLCYETNGVKFESITTATDPKDVDPVISTVTIVPQRQVALMKTTIDHTETNAPSSRVRDVTKRSDDLNKGFEKARYSYLVPVWTFRTSKATGGFDFTKGRYVEGKVDFAFADGTGVYRYIDAFLPAKDGLKVRKVDLYRSKSPADPKVLADLCVDHTGDLNVNRGSDYLYLCWS